MVKTDSRNELIINTIYNNLDDGKITIQQMKAYLYCIYELILSILDNLINMSEKSDSEEDYILNYNNFQSQKIAISEYIKEIENITNVEHNGMKLLSTSNVEESITFNYTAPRISGNNIYNDLKITLPKIGYNYLGLKPFRGMVLQEYVQQQIDNGINDNAVYIPDPNATWQQLGDPMDGDLSSGFGESVSISNDGTVVAGAARNGGGYAEVWAWNGTIWEQRGGDIDENAIIESVWLSGDGNRLAIGILDQNKVRIYEWDNSSWNLMGNELTGADSFGRRISLSDDGSRIAIGSRDSTVTEGVNNYANAGHVSIYDWKASKAEWDQIGGNIEGEGETDYFSQSLAISGDGTKVAVGAPEYLDGNNQYGYVKVYELNNNTWTLYGNKINGTDENQKLSGWNPHGNGVALSYNGDRLAISSNDDKIRIFQYNSGTWDSIGDLIQGTNNLGACISFNHPGDILAATAEQGHGFTSIYKWDDTSWNLLQANITAPNSGDQPWFCSLSEDGYTIAVGYRSYDSNSNANDNNGQVIVYKLTDP